MRHIKILIKKGCVSHGPQLQPSYGKKLGIGLNEELGMRNCLWGWTSSGIVN